MSSVSECQESCWEYYAFYHLVRGMWSLVACGLYHQAVRPPSLPLFSLESADWGWKYRYDYSTIPSPISTTLSTCPACLKICPCQRCVNPHVRPPPKPAPNAPRQSMKNRKRAIKRRKAGQFAARGSAKEPVRIGEVREVERRVFESAGVLEMRIRDERKKGRQEHWERFLTSSNTRSGEEDDYPPTKKKEDAYSSVDESEDSESEYEEKGYWLSSTESVESCATSLSGVTWSGGKGREGGKFLNRSKGVSP